MLRRRILTVMIIGVCILLSAGAIIHSVTIDSGWPVDEQVAELMDYISRLPVKNRAEWKEKATEAFEQNLHEPEANAPPFLSAPDDTGKVFISPSGSAYHRLKDCRGLRFSSKIKSVTIEEAENQRRKPCKICCGD
jgi:hypothetical protein